MKNGPSSDDKLILVLIELATKILKLEKEVETLKAYVKAVNGH